MNAYKITFELKDGQELDEDRLEPIWDYLGSLYKNGQILRSYELIEYDRGVWALATLPADDALEPGYNNIYVDKYRDQVEKSFHIAAELVGKNMNQDESCSCKDPSWYMLYTDWNLEESPVVCADCGKTVPLYRLPHIDDHEFHGVLGWQRAYKSTDTLWMYCLSDRFTYRQMHDPASQLSKDGIGICQAFEEKTGKPFYYYLYSYMSSKKRTGENCPVCGNPWEPLPEGLPADYRCAVCRLVADKE